MEKLFRTIIDRNKWGIEIGRREVEVKYLVIHTTASPQNWSWQRLLIYFKYLGWNSEGYHISVNADGTTNNRISADKISNGILPFKDDEIDISNENTINISWIGGIKADGSWVDNRTPSQVATLRRLTLPFTQRYGLTVLGHNQVAFPPTKHFPKSSTKICPCFDVPEFAKACGVPESQIYRKDNFKVLKFLKTGKWG